MRVTIADMPVSGCWQDRVTAGGRPWWIPDESPGDLGDPEIWADETAVDMYVQGYADPAAVMQHSQYEGVLIGATLGFRRDCAELDPPFIYRILCRRWSTVNGGRPYYVLQWPDRLEARERFMVRIPPDVPGSETRGGDRPDWAEVSPGEPLPEKTAETSLPPEDGGKDSDEPA